MLVRVPFEVGPQTPDAGGRLEPLELVQRCVAPQFLCAVVNLRAVRSQVGGVLGGSELDVLYHPLKAWILLLEELYDVQGLSEQRPGVIQALGVFGRPMRPAERLAGGAADQQVALWHLSLARLVLLEELLHVVPQVEDFGAAVLEKVRVPHLEPFVLRPDQPAAGLIVLDASITDGDPIWDARAISCDRMQDAPGPAAQVAYEE